MEINRTDTSEDNTSGYSSAKTSPQTSDDNLLKLSSAHKTRRRFQSKSSFRFDSDASDEETYMKGEEQSEFRPIVTPNDCDPHKEWYHKLLMLKSEFERGERGPFPPFPPPPLPSTMLAASQAVAVNPFEAVKRAASYKTAKSPNMDPIDRSLNRFCPTDFRPLPPPHVFLGMIKTLAPHQYVDLTYALAGSVLLEMGVKVPDRFPPLPPKIEPFRPVMDVDSVIHETEMSSQSSSGGEYSDASEKTKELDRVKRESNQARREARKLGIIAKRLSLTSMSRVYREKSSYPNEETFARDHHYKSKTLAAFIPPSITRGRRPPPLIPSAVIPPPPPIVPLSRGPIFGSSIMPPPMPPPIILFPFPIPHLPETPPTCHSRAPKITLKMKSPVVETKKTMLLAKSRFIQ
ncbi:unnamed protein product [Caenorhabditis sp. 36 PRJEB53466]|nr:unnamed protein product [Caenorhabditis sp. 36 PRJEB53466]